MAKSDTGGGARILVNQDLIDSLSDDDPLLSEEARAARVAATGAATGPVETSAEGTPAATTETPAETPAQPAAETIATEGEEWSEEDIDALQRLDGFLEEQSAARVKEVQSAMDKRITALQKENETRLSAVTQQLREAQLVGLTDDQKKALTEQWAYEDRKAELESYEKELEGYHRDVLIVAYTQVYGQYGITEERLADMSLDEMETFCLKSKADYLEAVVSGKAPAKPAAPGARAQAAPTTQAPAKPAQPAPAGAAAPSDVGGTAPAAKPHEFRTEQSREAMLDNLKNLPVERVGSRSA